MLKTLAVSNYRSIRKLMVGLGRLNIVTGANGSGKSNLYRALRLLAETSRGSLIASLAREGGLQSTLWAGPEKISQGMRTGRQLVQGTRFCLREFRICDRPRLPDSVAWRRSKHLVCLFTRP
jgi:predicted ATPase